MGRGRGGQGGAHAPGATFRGCQIDLHEKKMDELFAIVIYMQSAEMFLKGKSTWKIILEHKMGMKLTWKQLLKGFENGGAVWTVFREMSKKVTTS